MDCNTAEKLIHLYVKRELDGEVLEEFLEHVEHCPSCSEELEVNFSIYYALKQLNNEDDDSFDMKELLRKDIISAKSYLQSEDDRQFVERFLGLLAMLLLFLFLAISLEIRYYGGFQKSKLFRILQPDSIVLEIEPETAAEVVLEPETNHKKELILRIPETEEYKIPGYIPDET